MTDQTEHLLRYQIAKQTKVMTKVRISVDKAEGFSEQERTKVLKLLIRTIENMGGKVTFANPGLKKAKWKIANRSIHLAMLAKTPERAEEILGACHATMNLVLGNSKKEYYPSALEKKEMKEKEE